MAGDEITVFATAAVQEAYNVLVPQFNADGPYRVTTTWVPTVDLLVRIKNGERPDVVIMSAAGIDELVAVGRLAAGGRTDLASSGIGVAVRKGAPRPDISTTEALVRALKAATSVSYSTGPSGVYLAKLFERIGIAATLAPKLKVVKGEPIGAVVARGDAEIGFQQIPEVLPVTGIDLVGPLPAELQQVTIFSAGLPVGLEHAAGPAALLAFLRTPAAQAVFREKGMKPA